MICALRSPAGPTGCARVSMPFGPPQANGGHQHRSLRAFCACPEQPQTRRDRRRLRRTVPTSATPGAPGMSATASSVAVISWICEEMHHDQPDERTSREGSFTERPRERTRRAAAWTTHASGPLPATRLRYADRPDPAHVPPPLDADPQADPRPGLGDLALRTGSHKPRAPARRIPGNHRLPHHPPHLPGCPATSIRVAAQGHIPVGQVVRAQRGLHGRVGCGGDSAEQTQAIPAEGVLARSRSSALIRGRGWQRGRLRRREWGPGLGWRLGFLLRCWACCVSDRSWPPTGASVDAEPTGQMPSTSPARPGNAGVSEMAATKWRDPLLRLHT